MLGRQGREIHTECSPLNEPMLQSESPNENEASISRTQISAFAPRSFQCKQTMLLMMPTLKAEEEIWTPGIEGARRAPRARRSSHCCFSSSSSSSSTRLTYIEGREGRKEGPVPSEWPRVQSDARARRWTEGERESGGKRRGGVCSAPP